TLKMPAFEWVHVQLHQQKGMISLSPPTICNSALWITNHAWLNERFVLPESQQKNLAELRRSFLDPALKQINEKTPLKASYSIDSNGKFLFSVINKPLAA
ncbi:hypothetical protein ACRWXZ_24775, partial [Escherichia coli]